MRQAASDILLIEPVAFRYNEDSARTNAFMRELPGVEADEVQARALVEFHRLVERLRSEGVRVLVRRDTSVPPAPDAIFPNNWVTFHEDGLAILYPMEPAIRRRERRPDILEWLVREQGFRIRDVLDLSHHEREGRYLEGTGSMVLDRKHRIVYACVSPRTTPSLLDEVAENLGLSIVLFHGTDTGGVPVYHTNVVLALGTRFAILCAESIRDESERRRVLESLESTGHDVVTISLSQLHAFVGNAIELVDDEGVSLLVMSQRAADALSAAERRRLERYARIVSSPIDVIEECGGGSVRCMIAEIFLPRTV